LKINAFEQHGTEKKEGFFSVVDAVAVLAAQSYLRHTAKCWGDLKRTLKSKSAGEVYEKIVHFKVTAPDIKPSDRCDQLWVALPHQVVIPSHY